MYVLPEKYESIETLKVLNEEYAVCKFPLTEGVPSYVNGYVHSIARTENELSVVCPSKVVLENVPAVRDLKLIRVEDTKSFFLMDIVNKIIRLLLGANIKIFGVPRLNPNYVLIPSNNLDCAVNVLKENGYSF
jgi:hypothetical protein